MIWKAIPAYPAYEVSDEGQVRSMKTGRIIQARLDSHGYLQVSLSPKAERVRKRARIHRLVATAFLGVCPSGKQTNHRNGIKTDNHPTNLEYVTPGENNRHALSTGLRVLPRGEHHCRSKLRDSQIPEVFQLRQQGRSLQSIGTHLGVSKSQIFRILRGINRAIAISSAAR